MGAGTLLSGRFRATVLCALVPLIVFAPPALAGRDSGASPPPPRAAPLSGTVPVLLHGARAGSAPASVDSIRVRAGPGLESIARELAEDRRAFAPMPGIPDPLACGPVEVWVVRDLSRVPGLGPEPEAEEWVAGLALLGRNLVAVRAGEEAAGRLGALRRTFRHELAHVALACATDGGAPRWLQEGYAQLAAGDWNAAEAWRLRWILLREGGEALERLSLDFPEREMEARIAYLLSYTAVQKLHAMVGERGLASFFERLRAGDDVDAALRRTAGLTRAQFEERWRKSVADRYGWLYFFSRASVFWALLTIAVVALAWRRWRYDRRRLEALKEREAREDGWEPLEAELERDREAGEGGGSGTVVDDEEPGLYPAPAPEEGEDD